MHVKGINMTALREIKLLREIDNPYIVRLLDVFPHKRNLSLVSTPLSPDSSCPALKIGPCTSCYDKDKTLSA